MELPAKGRSGSIREPAGDDSPATRETSDRSAKRNYRLTETQATLLHRVVAAADSYASAVKTMHSFPPDLPVNEANDLVETAFSELRAARGEHLFFLLQAGAAGVRNGHAVEPEPQELMARSSAPETDLLTRLTPREREIVQRVAEGMRSKEIANALGISPKTVVTHRSHIMGKLGVHDTTGLVRFAIRAGLCQP
jgi:DNA-binding CsgD family transcriptional regulator